MVIPPHEPRQGARVVFGLFIIVVGVFALLDNLGLFPAHVVKPFWPLVFVALGAMRLARWPGSPRGTFGGAALVVLGAVLTLNNLHLLDFNLRDWWPLLLVFFGGLVMLRGLRPDLVRPAAGRFARSRDEEREEHGARVDASAVMSGLVVRNDAPNFTGGQVSAVLGGVELDLRNAAIVEGEARLAVSVIAGGVGIKVPREWSITVNGTPTLGGIEDKTAPPMTASRRLVIDASVVMGGVEISN